MKPRVLIGPAPLKGIEHVFGPMIRSAGYDLEYPPKWDQQVEVQMNEAEVLGKVPGCVASLAGSEPYTRKVIETAAPKGLRVIARAGVGYDAIDLAAATEHGIAVCFAPGSNQDAVAEHTFMLVLGLLRKLREQDREIRKGEWPRKVVTPFRGTTLGIVGLGRIGKAVAKRAVAFGVNILAAEIAPDREFVRAHGIILVPFEELMTKADVVSMHVPKTPLTRGMVNAKSLGLMKPTAYLVTTARGGIVNEADLYDALANKRIAGAGLDVFEKEPPVKSPLFGLDNVLLTAHTAGVDQASRTEMARIAATAIVKLLAGEWPAEWVVNPEVKDRFLAR
jgi:phosphoglycerate dehydrogenase-like enzyme